MRNYSLHAAVVAQAHQRRLYWRSFHQSIPWRVGFHYFSGDRPIGIQVLSIAADSDQSQWRSCPAARARTTSNCPVPYFSNQTVRLIVDRSNPTLPHSHQAGGTHIACNLPTKCCLPQSHRITSVSRRKSPFKLQK